MPNIRSTKSQLRNLDISNAKMHTSVEQLLKKDSPIPTSTNDIKWPQLNQEPFKLPPEKQSSPMRTTRQILPSSGSLEFMFPLPPSKPAGTLRSPSLPPYSSVAPPTSSSAEDLQRNSNGEFAEISAHTIRRTQSAADIRNPAQWKPLPARPLDCKNKRQREADKAKQRSSRPTRPPTESPPASIKGNQKLSLSERSSSSVPVVRKRTSTEENSERKERPTMKPQLTTNEDRNEDTTSINPLSLDAGNQESVMRFTAEQVLWLHQNYRGEATFLKAWGLHVTRGADREQGREIMEMIMAAESKEKEQSRHQKLQSQIDRVQHKTSSALESGDKGALDRIEE
ncbi:uncharacterized protein F4817DRAFT_365216 [Daldinia loculata]|uniref:uncharacterized protein n=1 Tax=Daldinia loculata TaxID=103429 RepID=UPI0020C3851B|nr:uncharacterized protein F4817DRAFT_365216 [Daldinia loculata]KAI1647472.1 hypothetical protein F4817DRAFT_365216 [Daldinia loculata]